MNLLPFFNLDKRDDFDIEIISKENFSTFSFQYFIPIYVNEKVDLPNNIPPLVVIPDFDINI
ncbi:hypothetical protein D3C79_1096160 [compost metagenome]